jgi:hypothetical protein
MSLAMLGLVLSSTTQGLMSNAGGGDRLRVSKTVSFARHSSDRKLSNHALASSTDLA